MSSVLGAYLPGDPLLIENIVRELKSQGIFDNFRKECISDVDTKPAYQNLRQRVEGSVSSFLRKQTWSPDMNKNQVRELLRKNIYESGYLEIGVERIVDQVVNPKINSIFLPKVTEVVYNHLGIKNPNTNILKEQKKDDVEIKIELTEETSVIRDENKEKGDTKSEIKEKGETKGEIKGDTKEETNENAETKDELDEKLDVSMESNDDMKQDDDESPPFEPLDEDNSMDSHLSGISGRASHDSNDSNSKQLQIDLNATNSNSEDVKMDIDSSSQESKVVMDESLKDSKLQKEFDVKETQMGNQLKEATVDSSKESKPVDFSSQESKSLTEAMDCGGNKIDDRGDEKESKKHGNEKENDDKDKHRHRSSEKSDRSRQESRSKDKYHHRDKDRDRKHSSSKDKDRHRSSSAKHSSSGGDKKRDDKKYEDKKYDERKYDDRKYDDRKYDDKKHEDRKQDEKRHEFRRDKDHKSRYSSSSSHSKSKDDKYKSSTKDSKSKSSESSHQNGKKDNKHGRDKKDDHFSSKQRERRSTDRDSNDGSGLKSSGSSYFDSANSSSHNLQNTRAHDSNSNDSNSNSHHSEDGRQRKRKLLPKLASNIYEAKRLMKIRKEMRQMEKLKGVKCEEHELLKMEKKLEMEEKLKEEKLKEEVPRAKTPPSMSVSMASWEALEAKLTTNMNVNYDAYYEPETPEKVFPDKANGSKVIESKALDLDSPKKDEENVESIKQETLAPNLSSLDKNSSLKSDLESLKNNTNNLRDNLNGSEDLRNTNKDLINSVESLSNSDKNQGDSDKNLGNLEDSKVKDSNEHPHLSKLSDFIDSTDKTKQEIVLTKPSASLNNECSNKDAKCAESDDETKESRGSSTTKKPLVFFTQTSIHDDEQYIDKTSTFIAKLEKEIEQVEAKIGLNKNPEQEVDKENALNSTISLNSTSNLNKPATLSTTSKSNLNLRKKSISVTKIKRKCKNKDENSPKRLKNNNTKASEAVEPAVDESQTFPLPLSPAESETEKSSKIAENNLHHHKETVRKPRASIQTSQRYSSDDLYKPRPFISRTSGRRRGSNLDT